MLLFLLLLLVVIMTGFLTVDLHLEARPLKFVLGVEHALLQVAHLLLLTLRLADAERRDALVLFAGHHWQSIKERVVICNHLILDDVGFARLDVDVVGCEDAMILIQHVEHLE